MAITTRQFRILADHMEVYDFMTRCFATDGRGGVPAPFLEYALSSEWMDKRYTHRWRLWLDDGVIVAFCFNESPVTDIYFSTAPGYAWLAQDMVAYAQSDLTVPAGPQRLVLFQAQKELTAAAAAAGFRLKNAITEYGFDMTAGVLNRPLPPGFRFETPGKADPAKASLCCWKGFDHEEEEGPWPGGYEGSIHISAAPHATTELAVAIVDDKGDYACWAGMWWTPANRLAYLEPLCTVPHHRGKGLAAAALSELYRRTKPLGAVHFTGGAKGFYKAIGFTPTQTRTFWTME